MFYPSGVIRPKSQEYIVEASGNGLYTVQNAYEGDFAYFKDRPIAEIKMDSRQHNNPDISSNTTFTQA